MAFNLGGILGAVGSLFGDDPIQRPAPTRTAGAMARRVTASGVGTRMPVTPGAPGIIAMILSGVGDAGVRVAARTARVGKKQIIETLIAMDEMSGGQAFSPTDKMFISSEIEKIFKRRRRPTVPKSLQRSVKQIIWIKKNLRGVFK